MGGLVELHDVSKEYYKGSQIVHLLESTNIEIPPLAKVALLGSKGSGKSTIIKLLSGLEMPTSGSIVRNGSVSFTIGSIQPGQNFTVRQYVYFVARIYGVCPREFLDFVKNFGRMASLLDERVNTLPQDARLHLNCAIFYGIRFELYLFDGFFAQGSSQFRQAVLPLFTRRTAEAGFVLATDSARTALEYCTSAIVLHQKKLLFVENIEDAVRHQFGATTPVAGAKLEKTKKVPRLEKRDTPILSRHGYIRLTVAPTSYEPGAIPEDISRYLEQGEWDRVIDLSLDFIEKGFSEQFLEVCRVMAHAYVMTGKNSLAISILLLVLKRTQDNEGIRMTLAKLFLLENRYREAKDILESIQKSVFNFEKEFLLAISLKELGYEAKCISHLRDLIAAKPSYLTAKLYLLELLLVRDPEGANKLLNEIQTQSPNDPRLKKLQMSSAAVQ